MEIFTTGFFPILISMALYGALHSLLASLTVKDKAERLFGKYFYQRWYRLLYNIIVGMAILPVLWLVATSPDRILWTIPSPWSIGFRGIQALALIGLGFALLQTGSMIFLGLQQLVTGETPPAGQNLVTGGTYRWVRHPIYTFSLAILWFSPSFTVNSLAFALGATSYILVGMIFEERKLVAEYGQVYQDYQKKTPALVPGLNIFSRNP
jgi:protein-S-isoprenylcysteine O-methyltransferase Ste14